MPLTDNSLLAYKVWLRVDHLPAGPVSVLDCYGGYGVVWGEVKRLTRRGDINRVGIDTNRRPGMVKGDNRKWLPSVDLSAFNAIDLDAYGVPFAQVKILFRRGYVGTVFLHSFSRAWERFR